MTEDCDSVLAELDAWLDGDVPPSERARIELHLATCEECRTIAEDARVIRPLAAALPQLEPPRDHWPAIRDRITQAPRLARGSGPPGSWRQWAAAAAVLVAVSSAITAAALWPTGSGPEDPPTALAAGGVPSGTEPTGPDPAEVAAEVRASAAELAQAVDLRRDQLDPETVAIVERNLEIVDQAIAEVEAALERDPADGRAQAALAAAYNQKVRLLQAVLRTPTSG